VQETCSESNRASPSVGLSAVTMKREMSPIGTASAFAITRRRRLQVSFVDHRKSLKCRAGEADSERQQQEPNKRTIEVRL